MKSTISLIALAAAAIAGLGACKKKTETTPEKPKGVVLCQVNGTEWQSGSSTSTIKIGSSTYYMTSATLKNDTLSFSGIRNQGDTSGIYFYSVPLKKGAVGMVTGTTTAFSGGIYLKTYDLNTLIAYLGQYNVTYELNVESHDATNKLLTGKFIISMTSKNGNINISNGEFYDLKYK